MDLLCPPLFSSECDYCPLLLRCGQVWTTQDKPIAAIGLVVYLVILSLTCLEDSALGILGMMPDRLSIFINQDLKKETGLRTTGR